MHYTSKAVYEYISKQNSDPIIERKKCRISGQNFPIYQSDLDFYDKISPKFEVSPDYAKKFLEENNDIGENFEYADGKLTCKIPTPTLCPEERQRRRLAFRNERKLYKRTCDFSGKEIISIYSPDKPYKVYDQNIWWSDKWDAMQYGVDIDMKKSFTEQFDTLLEQVPQLSLTNKGSENSKYANQTDNIKDSYLIFGSKNVEDSYYSNRITDCADVVDSSYINKSSRLYQCVDVDNSHNLYYCVKCLDCSNCYKCTNITNKQYCINNKQYSKKEYHSKLKNIVSKEKESKKDLVWEGVSNKGSEYIIGNEIYNSKEVVLSHIIHDSESLKYSHEMYNGANNSQDCYSGYGPISHCYECFSFGVGAINNISIMNCRPTNYNKYCSDCYTCSHCFGCVGLRNKEYCIFNKQYTKEEYNQLVPKIIAQMMRPQTSGTNPSFTSPFNKGDTSSGNSPLIKGDVPQSGTGGFDTTEKSEVNKVPPCEGGYPSETREGGKQRGEFFDPQLSPFGYNETVAMEYYPLTKEEAIKLGYKRSDYEAPFPKVEKFVQGSKLRTASCKTIHEQKPELLEKLLNYAVVCEVSGRPFRIIKQEIDFYIKHDLPLPRKHPDIRHQERMNKRPGRTLYLRNCDKCGEEMLSVYPSSGGFAEGSSIQQIDSSLCSEGQGEKVPPCEGGHPAESREGGNAQQIYCSSCYQKEIYG